ncbi:MAG: hypothetical protein IJE89_03375 [Bacilli bacterium]|nr:hypothetical protein [Bacilli bacterium]
MTDNKRLSDNKKRLLISISIVVLALTLVGGTFAYLMLGMDITNGNYISKTDCFDIIYDNTNDDGTMDIAGTLMPSVSYKGGLSGNMGIGSSCDIDAQGNLLLNISEQSSILTSQVEDHCENIDTLETLHYNQTKCNSTENAVWVVNGSALKYAVYDENNDEFISVGYVDTVSRDIKMYENFDIPSDGSLLDFKIYIWLDGNLVDEGYSFASLSGYIYADVRQIGEVQPEVPVLDSGMVPVTITDNGTVITISPDDSNWYDYNNKEWANVVLVKESGVNSRQYYLDNSNTKVLQSDILAYYVWIPRYKYKISSLEAVSIDIDFETAESAMSLGNAKTNYRTHPAFWWDNDNDNVVDSNEMLSGIWVGKFETTGSSTSPTILPNAVPLVKQKLGNQFTTSQKFIQYGLSNSSTDAHLMKNSDWGAVAYLSHSKYGINKEIRINNSSVYTGCGAATVDDGASTTCPNAFGTVSVYPQSTTGNITGVFDMSGGKNEYVMGHYGDILTSNDNSAFTVMPDKKYYDLYSTTVFSGDVNSNLSKCTTETCGGHALNETAGWYSDNKTGGFVSASSKPWFVRGGLYSGGASAGIFYFNDHYGTGFDTYSWRSAIVTGIVA